MTRSISVLALFLWVEACSPTEVDPYFPLAGDAWEHRSPAQLGMDGVALAEAVAHAIANEPDSPRDLEAWMRSRSGGGGRSLRCADRAAQTARWFQRPNRAARVHRGRVG